tara:strand:- start:925 stop:1803 length:879 start_codon:yes stop_codon:yes gene_type:complete
MKYLVIGGSGIIGSKFNDYLIERKIDFLSTYFQNKPQISNMHFLDITKNDQVIKTILTFKPDIIIHASALTNIDLCENDKELAFKINVKGFENVIDASKRIDAKIVFISTSHVFNKDKTEFSETDKTKPMNYYGETKKISEQMLINSGLDYLILRTDQPYCWNETWQKTNSVLRVIESISSLQEFREIIDWKNCPTYVPNFVTICIKLIEKNETGIFHVVGKDFLSRYEWSLKICEIFELDKKYLSSIPSKELKLPAIRPNVRLNCDKVFKAVQINLVGIEEGMLEMKKQIT